MNTPQKKGWVPINEFNHGLLVWVDSRGKFVADSDRNLLNIEINDITDPKERKEKGDALRAAARSYGIEGGHAQFLSGNRRVSDEEFENQKARRDAGLVPDVFDPGAIKDEMKRLKR